MELSLWKIQRYYRCISGSRCAVRIKHDSNKCLRLTSYSGKVTVNFMLFALYSGTNSQVSNNEKKKKVRETKISIIIKSKKLWDEIQRANVFLDTINPPLKLKWDTETLLGVFGESRITVIIVAHSWSLWCEQTSVFVLHTGAHNFLTTRATPWQPLKIA